MRRHANDADFVLDALLRMRQENWICFPEFRVEAGFGYVSEKRVDLLAIHPHASKRYEKVAYEIKSSASDFNRELRKPMKRWAGMLFTNRFYFAARSGLLDPKKIPIECGLVEVGRDGAAKVVVKAPWRECAAPTWPFVVSLARRIAETEK